MSKKHYQKVAKIIRNLNSDDPDVIETLIKEFIEFFKADNSAFDPNKFREACHGQ